MSPERIDALFVPFYQNLDRWHNDDGRDFELPSLGRTRGLLDALSDDRWMKDEVDLVIDGRLYDFSRFLSWVRRGDTSEHERYDAFAMTLLTGSYYASFLDRHGFSVRVVNSADREKLERLGDRYEPSFVMLSTTLLFDGAETDIIPTVVAQVRRQWPNACVVLGGLMLVSYRNNLSAEIFEQMLRLYGADAYVVTPHGESSMLELLGRGGRDGLLADPDIDCTYVLSNGELHEPGVLIDPGLSMEENYVRWSSLPHKESLYHTVHTRTARSCAFKCAFCEYPVNQGPLTLMPIEAVERELDELAAVDQVRSIIFTDDTFNVPLRRFKELLEVLARYDLEWYSFFRPQYADAETAELMRKAHCRAVFAGLESVDERVLTNMHKVAKVDDYRRGIEQLKKQGIQVHANFIVGFPGETEESARKIVPFLNEMEIDFCTVCTWVYLPSTPIGARAAELGIEGMGVDWKHATMTSAEAQILAREIVHEQKHSVHNAVRGEAWTEFLLYANGFTVDEVRLAISTFNRFLGRDTAAEEIEATPDYAALKEVLERRPMPLPGEPA